MPAPEPSTLAAVPFHFWSFTFFVFGCIVGSFLNVCIHRMPLGQSIVSPPSHCPHCQYQIPGYLNIPLVTWLWLRGKCANCAAPISARYFAVELLTGLTFLACWLRFGEKGFPSPIIYCVLLAGFIVATFIDFEHFIIPDEITIGGIAVGVVLSGLFPEIHYGEKAADGLKAAALGAVVGAGLVYGILRLGKLLFGQHRIELPENSVITFTENELLLPTGPVTYEELFYRKSDTVAFRAARLEMVDRCYWDAEVRLSPAKLRVGNDEFDPATVHHMEAVTSSLSLPREAMGFGDVKFMAAIGAFLGWPAVLFSLMVSAFIGSVVGVTLIVCKRREWSSRLPYGPYIALAAVIWLFGRGNIVAWLSGR
ncbi:MAG: Peptidase A24A domain protein [Limisphaerales bacterium]|nr:MAG: Peptidase A24A domain protein [Limisphaerales bacterium]KAG0508263.1 MAG: Peptidase A24A domain protein [Limisphaerales bacterium]TXT49578.1 MAG: Peptidase A24A domain protein [Limisphaerales bacterium]